MIKAYEIIGKPTINGTIKVQGSKNASLAIIIASLLIKDKVIIKNVPDILDIKELLEILNIINVYTDYKDFTLTIDSSSLTYTPLLLPQIQKFRASYYFIGVFLSLFNQVEIYMPGGCNIGNRPIDQHIKGLNTLDVNIIIKDNILNANCETIKGNEINLDIPSVGATINLILASVFASKKTIIKNAAKEPEIIDLVNFLNFAGANISGEGSSVIIISPIEKLNSVTYSVTSDRIVAGTYLIYGALFAKKLTLTNIETKDNYSLINTLINLGCQMDIRKDQISIYKLDSFTYANIKTDVHPHFPTDLQQIITTFLFNGSNVSIVEETIFENRFSFLKEIEKMGGKYFIYDNKAIIIPSKLKGNIVNCCDLRGGAAILLACLMASGKSIIKNIEFIERGYENIVETLKSVNVDIKEIQIDEKDII